LTEKSREILMATMSLSRANITIGYIEQRRNTGVPNLVGANDPIAEHLQRRIDPSRSLQLFIAGA
jgi:hypothetical protein